MKVIILALCLFAIVAMTTAAHEQKEEEENAEVERLMQELELGENADEKKFLFGLFAPRRRRRRRHFVKIEVDTADIEIAWPILCVT